MRLFKKGMLSAGQGTAVFLIASTLLVSACDVDDRVSSLDTVSPDEEPAEDAETDTLPDPSAGEDAEVSTSPASPVTPVNSDDDADEDSEEDSDSGNNNSNDDDGRVVNPGVDEDTALYSEDGYGEVEVIRVDVITRTTDGVCNIDDMSGCTLADVLADIDSSDDFKVDIPVHFQASDFADDGTVNNAELRQRGGGTRLGDQKSFRIRLDDKDELWRNERYLQLNKHPFESSRFRNKLAFDLMVDIPDLPSFRTQFVNLWIDDGDGPVDQGLYTHAERGDDDYLERHGLADGNLYKANFFRFTVGDLATLRIDEDGEPLNDDLFDTVLEVESGDDHRNLVAMLEDLLDPEVSFDDVLDQYFDEDNVLTWMAVNFLMGQQDATRHNYFLYNPEDTEKFYFLPWDYDSAFVEHQFPPNDFSEASLRARLDYGYAIGSSNTFLTSYYKSSGAHRKILAKAAQLRNDTLSDATVQARETLLKSVSSPYASVLPDIEFNEFYSSSTGLNFDEVVANNDVALRNTFGIPLPPTLAPPQLVDGNWQFEWTDAYDVSGSSVTYDLQISESRGFGADTILLELINVDSGTQVDAGRLGSGELYVRLIARRADQPSVYWQVADNVLNGSSTTYYGVVRFSQ